MQLQKIDAAQFGLPKTKAEAIESVFIPMVDKLKSFDKPFAEVMAEAGKEVTEPLTQKARQLRLDIRQVRIDTENARKSEKEEYLRGGKAVDGIANIVKFAITDMEESLEKIEKHFELIEQQRIQKIQDNRIAELSKYDVDASGMDLAGMTDQVWNNFLSGSKANFEAAREAERKAEQLRIEAEQKDRLRNQRMIELGQYRRFFSNEMPDVAELTDKDYTTLKSGLEKQYADHEAKQEKIRQENEKLRKEREAAEKKAEAERKAAAEQLQKEREAREAAERAERQRLEAEKRKVEEEAEAIRRAQSAPDKDKLNQFASEIEQMPFPSVKTPEAKKVLADVQTLVDKTVAFIRERSAKL